MIRICIIYLLFNILFGSIAFAQQSSNIQLHANIDQHSADGLYSSCWGYTSPVGREYAILGCAKGTAFIDVTNLNNIREVAYVPGVDTPSCCREMKVFSHYAYVVADGVSSGLQIIDLQYLPDSARLVNTFFFNGFSRGHTISQNGPYLYINAGDYFIGGLFVLDITNPESPVKRGEWESQVVHDCRVVNDTIFACNIYSPPGTISIIDASDKNNLRTITSWENIPQPGPHNIAISPDRRIAYVTDEIGGNPRLLKIWEISNIFDVIKLSEWHPPGITTSIIHNVELYGNYLFAAHYTAGLRIVDIRDPSNPFEAAFYDTYRQNDSTTFDGCWGPFVFPSEKILASDRSTGLYIFRTAFKLKDTPPIVPDNFRLFQNYPNPFNPSTTIKYCLKYDSYVTLKIYDASGRQSAVLVDGNRTFGDNFAELDAANFASGIYFYTIVARYNDGIQRTFVDSKKMAFIK
ncbi:MAG: choice-of-anchor B family protein [Ignavibacteria bacterium]|nr:choice-of-anchor B family protein [Ignavibacteria bacterium]